MTTPGDFYRGTEGGARGESRAGEERGLKERASGLAHDAKEKAADQIEHRVSSGMNRFASTLTHVADSLRQTSNSLAENGEETPRQYVDRAADQVERFADYVRQQDLDHIVHDVEGFARRQPGVFLGGAFLIGLVAARFLKSSRPSDGGWGNQQSGYATGGYAGTGYGRGYGQGGAYESGYGRRGSTDVGGTREREVGSGQQAWRDSPADVSLRQGGDGWSRADSGADTAGRRENHERGRGFEDGPAGPGRGGRDG